MVANISFMATRRLNVFLWCIFFKLYFPPLKHDWFCRGHLLGMICIPYTHCCSYWNKLHSVCCRGQHLTPFTSFQLLYQQNQDFMYTYSELLICESHWSSQHITTPEIMHGNSYSEWLQCCKTKQHLVVLITTTMSCFVWMAFQVTLLWLCVIIIVLDLPSEN